MRKSIFVLIAAVFSAASTAVIGPVEAAGQAPVLISEIHYNPSDGTEYEFIELHNPSGEDLSLDGFSFTTGVTALLDGVVVPANGYVILAPETNLTQATYGIVPVGTYQGKLSNKGEIIILAQGELIIDEVEYDDKGDWPTAADGAGPSLELIDFASDNSLSSNWFASDAEPTPGAANNQPIVSDFSISGITASPGVPSANESVRINVQVEGDGVPNLVYRVGHESPVTTPMDEVEPGRFQFDIPGQTAGELIRYRVEHGSVSAPVASDSRDYLGVVVANPSATTDGAPILEYFMDDDDYATMMANPEDRSLSFSAVVAYDGEVFDGATVAIRGGDYARQTYDKLALGFDLPKGFVLQVPGITDYPVDEFALATDGSITEWARAETSWWLFEQAGFPRVHSGVIRLERNASFQGVYRFQEKLDGTWRNANNLDSGDFFKATAGGFRTPTGFDQRSGDTSGPELLEITQSLDGASTSAQRAMLFSKFDVPALVNYVATGSTVGHYDSSFHNFYVYRDTKDTGLWSLYPWDLNNTFATTVFDCNGETETGLRCINDPLMDAVYGDATLEAMVWARIATLTSGPLASDQIRQMHDARVAAIGAETADLDKAAWPRRFHIGETGSYFHRTVDRVRAKFANESRVPTLGAPSSVVISEVQHSPSSDEPEFLELVNTGSQPVDLSGWQIEAVFKNGRSMPGGTILLPGARLVMTESITLLQAAYSDLPNIPLIEFNGSLKGSGETIELVTASGLVADSVTYSNASPWPQAVDNRTLELIDLQSDNDLGSNWSVSSSDLGSPGQENAPADDGTGDDSGSGDDNGSGDDGSGDDDTDDTNTGHHTITLTARGTTGQEQINLNINGQTHANLTLTTTLTTYEFTTTTAINNINIQFTNDGQQPTDRNVYIDNITLNNTTYETEAPSTHSTGTYGRGTGCAPGNKSSSWLHCNGHIEYAIQPLPTPTTAPQALVAGNLVTQS